MARQRSGRKENHVEAQRRRGKLRMPAEIVAGRPYQPALIDLAERLGLAVGPAAALHLDEYRGPESLDDQVDLADRAFEAALDDTVELDSQPQRGQRFAAAPLPLSGEPQLTLRL